MASISSMLVDNLSCSVCCDIFNDPVILSCSHSFCKGCLQSWWIKTQTRQCPLCMRTSSKAEPPSNLSLKNLSETFRQQGDQRDTAVPDDLCTLHGEKLKLFCLDHQEMVCIICRDSEQHVDHRFRPISEAAHGHREQLQELLKPQKKTLAVFIETKRKCDQMAAHIKVQTEHTERQIEKEFKKLHQFLNDEEKSRIAALRVEGQLKGQSMEMTIEGLSMQIEPLSDTVKETEKQLRAGDLSFLKNYKAIAEKSAQPTQQLPAPKLPRKALIDVAKHLGNLAFTVCQKLKETFSYNPVILDPNTAGAGLILSEDLTSVRCGERQQLPENPERLTSGVLGSRLPGSGTYSWDVEVGDSTHWELGVSKGVSWMMRLFYPPYYKIGFFQGKYRSSKSFESWMDLPAMHKLQRIRIKLDCNIKEIFFIDPESNIIIHKFSSVRVPTFPFLYSTDKVPLKISPVK